MLLGAPGSPWVDFWSILGRFWVHFGWIWGPFWTLLGAILGDVCFFLFGIAASGFFVAFACFHFLRLLSDAFVCYYTALLLLLATLVCCLLLFAALGNQEQPRATENNCLHALSVPCFSGK